MSNSNGYSVSTEHIEYTKNKKIWQKIDDCIAGEEVIKAKKDLYLPRPSGMDSLSKEGQEAYNSYITRAHFPSFTTKFLSALTGIAKLNKPDIVLPDALNYLLEDCDGEGTPLDVYFFQSITESLKSGRQLIFCDVDDKNNRLKMVRYNAIDIINWGVNGKVFNNREADFFVIAEDINKSTDIFEHEYEKQYRVLTTKELFIDDYISELMAKGLSEDEAFRISIEDSEDFVSILFDDGGIVQEMSTPKLIGIPYKGLPVVIIGSTDLKINPDTIPLYGVASCALQMYMKDADLSNSMFLTCNPTLCMTGITENKGFNVLVGSNIAITAESEGAKIYYTTTDASGLAEVRLAINMYLSEAQSMGSALLSDNPKGVESEGALRIKSASMTASLSSTIQTCARGFEEVIKKMAIWMNIDTKDIKVDLDNNYLDDMMTNDDITSIVKLYINDMITHESALVKLKKGEVLDEDFDIDKEVKVIKEEKEKAIRELQQGIIDKDAAKEGILNNHIKQTDRSKDDALVDTKVNY